MIAVIGGTGVYNPYFLTNPSSDSITTPFGTVQFNYGTIENTPVYFMTRHGGKHSTPPHLINYRGNIWALKKLGVQKIFATAAVGSLKESILPGSFVVINDFIDLTHGRENTFFVGGEKSSVLHLDCSNPYCENLRDILLSNTTILHQTVHENGTYVCTQGPRYESKSEVKMMSNIGGAVVGMTGLPECILAREAEICYATIALVTNHATGIANHQLTFEEVKIMMQEKTTILQQILMNSIKVAIKQKNNCKSNNAAYEVGGFKF